MGSKIRSRSLVWKKNLLHFYVKWSDMISDHLKSDHPTLWKSVVHIKDWYCSMVSSNIADLLHTSEVRGLCLMKWPCIRYIEGSRDRGIAGSYDPDLPLNLGSKIRSRSRFKIGIGSDRNRSEVIEIDRDREKIVDLQCTGMIESAWDEIGPWQKWNKLLLFEEQN